MHCIPSIICTIYTVLNKCIIIIITTIPTMQISMIMTRTSLPCQKNEVVKSIACSLLSLKKIYLILTLIECLIKHRWMNSCHFMRSRKILLLMYLRNIMKESFADIVSMLANITAIAGCWQKLLSKIIARMQSKQIHSLST